MAKKWRWCPACAAAATHCQRSGMQAWSTDSFMQAAAPHACTSCTHCCTRRRHHWLLEQRRARCAARGITHVLRALAGVDRAASGTLMCTRGRIWRQGVGALRMLQEVSLEQCVWADHNANSLLRPLALLTRLRHLTLSRKNEATLQDMANVSAIGLGEELQESGHLACTAGAVVHAVVGIVTAVQARGQHPPPEVLATLKARLNSNAGRPAIKGAADMQDAAWSAFG
jgi:hypothetical protein